MWVLDCAIHIDINKRGKQEMSKWECTGNGYWCVFLSVNCVHVLVLCTMYM